MLDEWAALVRDQHRPPTGAVAAADSDSFYAFLPTFEGAVRPGGGGAISFATPCFDTVRVAATISRSAVSAASSLGGVANASALVEVIIEATRRRALGCTDLLLLTTTASLHLEPVRTLALSTRHTVRWGGLSPLELADVRASGVRLFRMPKGMAGTLVSAYETALLFVQPALFRCVGSAAVVRR